jgi:hypothetical protein
LNARLESENELFFLQPSDDFFHVGRGDFAFESSALFFERFHINMGTTNLNLINKQR